MTFRTMLHSLLAAAMLVTCVEAGAEDIDPTQQQLCDTMYYYFDMGQRDRFIESARQVISQLSREVEAHRGGAEPSDDLTMLCLKIDNNK